MAKKRAGSTQHKLICKYSYQIIILFLLFYCIKFKFRFLLLKQNSSLIENKAPRITKIEKREKILKILLLFLASKDHLNIEAVEVMRRPVANPSQVNSPPNNLVLSTSQSSSSSFQYHWMGLEVGLMEKSFKEETARFLSCSPFSSPLKIRFSLCSVLSVFMFIYCIVCLY